MEKTNSIDKEDLEQEGFIGLITAAAKYKFNIEKPCKFITYAVYWIYQRMDRFMNSKSTNEEVSIYTPIGDEDGTELLDTLRDDVNSYESVEEKIYNQQLRKELEEVMEKYNTLREREVLKLRYGWNNNECMTFEEIGEVFNVTGDRVRHIEYKSLRTIRRTPWGYKKAQEYYRDRFSNNNYKIDEKIKALDFKQKYLRYRNLSDEYLDYIITGGC